MTITTRHPAETTTTVPSRPTGSISALAGTIIDIFRDDVRVHAERPALRWRAAEGWEHLTWRQYGERVWDLATGFVGLGLEPGDRVAILSANRPEWHLVDLATIAAGGVSVPIYSTSASSQVAYMLAHSGARICVVDGVDQLAKVLLRRDELPELRHVVVLDPGDGLDAGLITGFAVLESRGRIRRDQGDRTVDERARDAGPDDLLTIVYTSGTTGPPKGTMLTHRNVLETVRSITTVVPTNRDDRFLSFLPLSHIAERTVSHFGQIVSGGETWFARGISTVADDLSDCRPTIFFAVPRVWEKFQEAIIANVAQQPDFMRQVFDRYLDLGLAVVAHRQEGAHVSIRDRALYLAMNRSVGSALRHKLGLDQARVLVSGAAPIHQDLLRWFHAIGLPIAEVYGQTEDCGPTSLNPPHAIRIGTAGPPIPGVQIRIAADGEVLVKGPNVCVGYYEAPEATAQLIDQDGWMHSGDLGALDPDGYLRITGRKKDLIINAAGKNIAPEPIEADLRMEPLISQAVVIGDARPYLVALITIDPEEVASWAAERGKLPEAEALTTDADLLATVGEGVERVNSHRSRVEQIKRWRVLAHDFTIASGELTSTLKVRRSVVTEHHAELIDELYAGSVEHLTGGAS